MTTLPAYRPQITSRTAWLPLIATALMATGLAYGSIAVVSVIGCKGQPAPSVADDIGDATTTIQHTASDDTSRANAIDRNDGTIATATPAAAKPVIVPILADNAVQTAAIRANSVQQAATSQPLRAAVAADGAKDSEIAKLKADAANEANGKIAAEVAIAILVVAGGVVLIAEGQLTWGIGVIVFGLAVVCLGELFLANHRWFTLGGELVCVGGVGYALYYELHKSNVSLGTVKTAFAAIGTDAEGLVDSAWEWLVKEFDGIIGKKPPAVASASVAAASAAASAASAVVKASVPAAK